MGLDLTFGRSLKALPRGCNNLKHLIYLHLGNCQGLKELPKSIGELKKLENLHLGFGSFTKLPGSLGGLKMLVVLDLGNCTNLQRLPKSIGKLEMLVTLNLFQCSALNDLPLECHALKRLESLNLLGCGRFNYFTRNLVSDLHGFVSLRNLKIDAHNFQCNFQWNGMPVRSLVIHKASDSTLYEVQSIYGLEDLLLHTGEIKVFPSRMAVSFYLEFLNLKTLRLSFLPNLQSLGLNHYPNLVNFTLNDCPNLEEVELTNCPNLVCLPALDSLPRLHSLILKLSIEKLPQSFTHRGAFPALNLFNLGQSKIVEFPEVEEGAMPKLQWLDFDNCISLHTLPISISLLTSIQTINFGSKNEKLMTSCQTNFSNSPIRKSFIMDGKPLIPEEEVFELVIPMQEGTTRVRGSDKRPFQKVHGDDEERLFKRGGSILGRDLFLPSSPKRFVFRGSSSLAEPTKSEKEYGLCEAL
jgi:Leucine-rich repeat (LRR) protein